MESADEKKRLPAGKTIARGNWLPLHFHLPFLLAIFIDKQRKAVSQSAEIKGIQARLV